VDTPHNTRSIIIPKKIISPQQIKSIQEKILIADKKSIVETINSTYEEVTDTELPTPEEFSVIKSRKGWEIRWKTTSSVNLIGLKYSVMIFEPVAGGGYLNKTFKTTEVKKVLIPRKSDFKPAKVLFGIVSINKNGYQSPFPKLFRIKGRHIVFN
jgi:hypothetical protein